jgi:2-dehydro-3-deoxygluconokinase
VKTIDILAIGEPLMELAEVERSGERLYLPGFGGDVSNAAIAAARQGAKAAVFTALGDDAFGRDFLALWDREGLDRSTVITRAGGRTGVYFISYGEEGHVFSYARAGSAASVVTADELPFDQIAASQVLHVSGISQAISTTCTDAVFAAIRHAIKSGTLAAGSWRSPWARPGPWSRRWTAGR